MRICANCGAQVPDDSVNFCAVCGQALPAPETPMQGDKPLAETVEEIAGKAGRTIGSFIGGVRDAFQNAPAPQTPAPPPPPAPEGLAPPPPQAPEKPKE